MSVLPLAARLRSRTPLIALLAKMPCVPQVEMAAYAGFDALLLDTEHGPAGDLDLEHHLRAADSAGIPVLVRVPSHHPASVLSALDAGARGIVVPHVLDAPSAIAATAAAYYPPRGSRGLALSTRAGRYGAVPLSEHLRRAAEETCVVVQIEDADGIDAADKIMAVDGIDAVLIGAIDLSMALGHPGSPDHPDVAGAIDRVINLAAARGIAVAAVAGSLPEVRAWRARGASIVFLVASQLVRDAFAAAALGS